MNKRRLHLICIIFSAAVGGYSVTTSSGNMLPVFISLYLLYLLNMQIRYLMLEGRFALLSIIVELVLVCILGTSFGGLLYLLAYLILVYGISSAEKYFYGISALTLILLIYLIRDIGRDYVFLNAFMFTGIWILLYYLKGVFNKVNELEHLYDDVRRYSYELENTKRQVEAYSKRVEELAQLEERNRISEEIHDTVGHRLTALLIQMEAGMRIMDYNPLKGRELLSESRDSLRESIDVLRETVKGMKPKEYKNFLSSIEDMIGDFKKKTSINVSLSIQGNPMKLYPGVETVLYRNLQEALTNSVKHGRAHNIEVILKYTESTVALKVTDDGIGSSEVIKGMGIAGMEERTGFVGGRINLLSDKGFVMECIIPLND